MSLHAAGPSARVLLWVALLVAPAIGQTTGEIDREVRRELGRETDLRAIDVRVDGAAVTLAGRVPTFWAKTEAIRRTLDVDGVETVVSELEIPAVENDGDLAVAVGDAVWTYPHYTLWDYIDGHIDRGVVTLFGSVTPERDKSGDLVERVGKIRGVQDVRNTIEIQPASSFDGDIRAAIASRMFNSTEFREYTSRRNPPFHIVVSRGRVRLVGAVRSEVEKRRLEQLVRDVLGVLQVVNDLRTD